MDNAKSAGAVEWSDRKSIIIYLILTCIISWTIWIFSGVLSWNGEVIYDYHWLIAQVGVF